MRKSLVFPLLALMAFSAVSCARKPAATHSASTQSGAKAKPAVVAPSRPAESAARQIVDQLAKGDYKGITTHFDAALKAAMTADQLREGWEMALAQGGHFKKQLDARAGRKLPKGEDTVITCQFERGQFDVEIVFGPTRQISGMRMFPTAGSTAKLPYDAPGYAKPGATRESSVKVGKMSLPGTLTMPAGNGPFPAVVLLHDFGAHDRDEIAIPNRPFRDIAMGLASRGVAVLRYDKRTLVYPKAIGPGFTVKDEVVDDAVAAAALLRKTPRIDARRVCVAGFGTGGMLAPRVGLSDSGIAGLIVMAGPTRPVEDLLVEQTEYVYSLKSRISEPEKKQLAAIRQIAAMIKDPKLSAGSPPILSAPPGYWLDLRGYKPAEVARGLKQPMLILHGERDFQTRMVDFQSWKQGLSSRKDVTFKLYPGLNHLFMLGKGKGTPQEYQTSGHVSEEVIGDIADWVKKR